MIAYLTKPYSLKSAALVLVTMFYQEVIKAQTPGNDTALTNPSPGYSIDKQFKPDVSQNKPPRAIYRMNYWTVGSFCLAATALDIYAIPNVIKNKKGLTPEEITSLDPGKLTGFDHWTLEQDAGKRDHYYEMSDYGLPVIVAATAALGFDKKIRKDWVKILLMYYETHAITFSVYNFSFFGPAFQNKLRPVVYYNDIPEGQRNGGNMRNSMYSGHTASAAAATFFMVKVYSDYHPELGGKKYILYALATLPPMVEGYLRVKALAHFTSDVMIGVAIGAFCGITVPSLHKFRNKNVSLGLVPTPAGPGFSPELAS